MFKRLTLAIILSFSTAALLHAADPVPAPAAPSGELGKIDPNTPVEPAHPAPAHADAHGDAHADAHGDHEKAPLLPDVTKSETWYQALWVVIIFLVLLAVLYPTAWKSVLAGLKAREDKIRKDIADAEAARARAEATLKDYTAKLAAAEASAREIINKASIDAETAAGQIRARSQADAEEMKERALKDIDAARAAAVREVYDQAALLATNVAEKILRRNLNADDQRDLVAQSLEQMQTVSKN